MSTGKNYFSHSIIRVREIWSNLGAIHCWFFSLSRMNSKFEVRNNFSVVLWWSPTYLRNGISHSNRWESIPNHKKTRWPCLDTVSEEVSSMWEFVKICLSTPFLFHLILVFHDKMNVSKWHAVQQWAWNLRFPSQGWDEIIYIFYRKNY